MAFFSMDQAPPCVLIPFCQNYDWGKLGSESVVAQLAGSGNGLEVDESKPYAELWMGAHPNGPCYVSSESERAVTIPIKEYLSKNSLGEIQFLFKVLSVRKALSIQSHPDAKLARELHAKFPDIYKDPNPKPELAIAISRFRALYGFRPAEQIVEFGRRFPQLLQIIGEREISGSPVALKKVYSSLMHASRCKVKEVIDSILQSSDNEGSVVEVARDLNDQYPGGDVGVLSVFFLNIVDLLPGQAIFIGPNVPHAYLSGDLIECMTCSDNVIRGGLTSKFKDVETLLASLDFAFSGPPKLLLQTRDQTWSPENVPFAVKEYKGGSFEIKPETESPAIALVIEGEGSVGTVAVKRGKSLLLIPGIVYRVESEYIRIFIAFTPKNYII